MPNGESDNELRLVTDWLVCASSLIGEEYIQLPVADGDPHFRERVYCYELYHRWRCHWGQGFRFSLCGELNKRGYPLICGTNLVRTMPDFLVHVPGEIGEMTNLLVMEVKSARGEMKKIVEDLEKLTAYRRNLVDQKKGQPANYHAAYLWVYGISDRSWPEIRDQVLTRIDRSKVELPLIRCFVHEKAQVPAVEVFWS